MIARFLTPALAALSIAAPVQANADIQHVISPGGIEAWLVQDETIPFVAIDLWFDGGGSIDEADARGATALMTYMLEEGAGDMDQQSFAAQMEGLAASFDFDIYRDEIVISAEMLSQNRDEAVALLRAALVEPRFDEGPLERVRGQVLSGIESDATDPETIAGRTFAEMTYIDHHYGTSLDGTLESVAALTRDDLVQAHERALTRNNVAVGVAGDITPEELGALLDTLLGDLPEGPEFAPVAAELMLDGGIEVVDFPTPQSSVFFGQQGIARDDPDFFPLFVLNEALGAGGYRSRLMEEVREERGLTYGIGTWFSLGNSAQMLQGAFSSSNDLVAEAIEVVQAEWADVAENGITQAEMEAVQRYLTGAYPLRFDGNGDIAGILAAMQSDDLPIDYIATRNDRVMAVTMEDIQRVAERVFNPDELLFVVVGQPEGLALDN